VVVFAGGIVLAVLAVVVRDTHALAGVDSAVADWGDDHATSVSTSGLKIVTDLGTAWVAVAAIIVVALVELVRTRSRWVVPFLLAVVVGDKLLTGGLKTLIDRVRPNLNPVARTLGPSFPSGHSSTAAALWAAVGLIAWRWLGRRSLAPLAGVAVAFAVGVAASRVLLDVHWLTDVIAGLALGWAWFAACAVAFGARVLRFGEPRAVSSEPSAPPGDRHAGGPPVDELAQPADQRRGLVR
jgi:membrane-associated phospholipid phosphatase